MKKKLIILGIFLLFISIFFILLNKDSNDSKKSSLEIDFPVDINTWTLNTETLNDIDDDEKNLLKKKEDEKLLKIENDKKIIEVINLVWSSGDVKQCEFIEDDVLKIKCKDNWNLYNASIKNETKYCNLIIDDYYKEKCLDDLNYKNAIELNDSKMCDKIINKNIRQKCNSFLIISKAESNDENVKISDCNLLTWEDKLYCQNIIKNKDDISILNEALDSKNSNNCLNISNTSLKNTCFDTLNLEKAINQGNLLLCNKIIDSSKKDQCKKTLSKVNDVEILKTAIEKNDLNLCETITLLDYKNQCYDNILLKLSILNKDKEKCSLIKSKDILSQCNSFFISNK